MHINTSCVAGPFLVLIVRFSMGYDSEICLARSLILQLVVSVVAMVACVCVDWSTGFRGHLYIRQREIVVFGSVR